MKPRGSYKLLGRARIREPGATEPAALGDALRSQRIVDSLRWEIGQEHRNAEVRIRQVFATPREIYRVELQVPELGYMRTTLLDRDALEELLEAEEVRDRVSESLR